MTVQGAGGGSPLIINGDIYSSGDMIIDSYVQIMPNSGKPSSVFVNGSLVMDTASYVSGDAHANGDILMHPGAGIGYNAYAGGAIVMEDTSGIGNSSYAGGDITLNNFCTIGNSTESGGNINVLHLSNSHPEIKTEIFGNAVSSQNITVNGASIDSDEQASAIINGNATAGGTITILQPVRARGVWYSGGAVNGVQAPGIYPAPLQPSLPPLPVLENPELAYWDSFYYQEAHGLNPPLDDPDYPTPLPDPGCSNATYESGTIYLHSNAELSLGPMHVTYTEDYPTEYAIDFQNNVILYLTGTVYVDGKVYIDNNCQIIGGGKLVATGDITIKNSAFSTGNSTNIPLIVSLEGDVEINNVGTISAVLYAPNGSVDIGANDIVEGSVVGQSVTNGNNVVLTYDERVRSIPGLPGGNTPCEETSNEWEEFLPEGVYIDWYIVVK